MRQNAGEQTDGIALPISEALIEVSTASSQRRREVIPSDLPRSFAFNEPALAYGRAQVERGVHIFEELGVGTETKFTYRIDPGTQEFVLADAATKPEETITGALDTGDGQQRKFWAPGVSRSWQRQSAWRELKLIAGQLIHGDFTVREAFTTAIIAHTHPPTHPIGVNERYDATLQRRLLAPVNAGLPSTRDVLAPLLASNFKPHMVFCPGGLTIMLVPTDWSPKLSYDDFEQATQGLAYINQESEQLHLDYLQALANRQVPPLLEGVLRAMYGQTAALAFAEPAELLDRTVRFIATGDAHATMFNPLTYNGMSRLADVLSKYGMVGYYNLAATDGNTFTRFTV